MRTELPDDESVVWPHYQLALSIMVKTLPNIPSLMAEIRH